MDNLEELHDAVEFWWRLASARLLIMENARALADNRPDDESLLHAFHDARQSHSVAVGSWLEANKALVEAMKKRNKNS